MAAKVLKTKHLCVHSVTMQLFPSPIIASAKNFENCPVTTIWTKWRFLVTKLATNLASRHCTGLTTFGQDCSLSKHWRDLSKSKFRTKQSQQVLLTNLSNVNNDETERFMPLQNLLGSNWLVLILPLGRLVKLTARLSLHLR